MTLSTITANTAPSKSYMTDEYRPTNVHLWEKVLEVAKGERREFTLNERTIHAPNNGQGFRPWPNPNGSAWAVKQYKGFGGGWQRKQAAAGPTEIPGSAVWLGNWLQTYSSFRNLPEVNWRHHVKITAGTPKLVMGGIEVPLHAEVLDPENRWQKVLFFDFEAQVGVIPKGASFSLALTVTTNRGTAGPEHIRGVTRATLSKAIRGLSGHKQLRDFQLDTTHRKVLGGVTIPFTAMGKGAPVSGELEIRVAQGRMPTDIVPTLQVHLGPTQQALFAHTKQILARTNLGPTATLQGSQEHALVEGLQREGLVRLSHVQGAWHYWTATFKGGRLVRAGLGEDLRQEMSYLLAHFDAAKAEDLGKWIEANFRINSPKTPKGGKELKDRAQKLVWVLKHRKTQTAGADQAEIDEKIRAEVEADWKLIEPHLAQFVAGFTDEGGKIVPKEIQFGGVTYINEVGVDVATVEKYAKRLDTIFRSIQGWRDKAMKGGLKVVLASPRNFRGTVGGKYKTNEDALYVRATPNVLKRGAGYGSFEYIIIHELGHRFERYNRVPEDFDKVQWWTTRYSRNEGESFAELFALSHFNLTGSWDTAVVERFERLMSGQKDTSKPELPEHLRQLRAHP